MTLRVYPPDTFNQECKGSLYLDDGVSFAFRDGDFRRINFACRLTPQGLVVTVMAPEGSFTPWWSLLSVEVYGAGKAAGEASYSALDGTGAATVSTSYNPEYHRITALVPDTSKGLELKLSF